MIIRKQDRLLYYDCLQTANEGDTRPFIRFIAHCTEKTLDVYLWATREVLPKIGQDRDSILGKERFVKLKRDETDSADIKPKRKPLSDFDTESESRQSSGKFMFTSVDEISPWHSDEENSVNTFASEKNRKYIPPTPEDDILSEDEDVGSVPDYKAEYDDYRDHLWFASDEEKIKVRDTGRFSRVLDEQGIFDDAEILEHLRHKDKAMFEDEDSLPRSE